MFIYFRACEKQATISNVTRFSNIDKTTLLRACWLSIQASVDETDTIIIVHDEVCEDTLIWLENTSKTANLDFVEVEEHIWEKHQHTITLVDILEEYCNKYPNDIHYIVEDDYLHTKNAISVIKNNLSQWTGFAVPYDYPDRYYNPQVCKVLLGEDRHWRTIDSSTMTVIALGSTWLKVIDLLRQAAPTSNDKVFEEIYKHIACISPILGIASHMTDRHATPFVDWESLWLEYTE